MTLSTDQTDINKYDLSSKFSEAWQTNDLFVKVNGAEVRQPQVLTFEILWSGSSVKGVVSFEDIHDLYGEGNLQSGFLECGWTSFPTSKIARPSTFKEKFVITHVHSGTTDSGRYKVTTINFEDYMGHKLKNTYHAEAYTNKASSDFLVDFYKDLKSGIAVIAPVIDAYRKVEEKVNLVTPGNMNAFDYIQREQANLGYAFVIDKFINFAAHKSNLKIPAVQSTGEIFTDKMRDPDSRTNIIEYTLSGYDAAAVNQDTPTATMTAGTDQAEYDGDINKMPTEYKLPTQKDTKTRATAGIRMSDGTDPNPTSSANMQKMKIWVPGWNGNRLMMKVQVQLAKTVDQNSHENAKGGSGEWLVYAVRDKIINSYFVQELFLMRNEGQK